MIKNYEAPYDPSEGDFMDASLDELLAQSIDFKKLEDRTHEALWSLLGSIFEIAPAIEDSSARRERLLARIADDPQVEKSNQWKPREKQIEELLLVWLFGLKRRQTRNQRLSALNIAAKEGIERTRSAFVEWMRQVGGVGGSRKSTKSAGSSPNDLRYYADQLKKLDRGFKWIAAPMSLTDPVLPDGLGVVLVRKDTDGAIMPLGTLTNEKLIKLAARELLGEISQREQADPNGADVDSEETYGEAASRYGRELIEAMYNNYLAQ